MFDPNLAKIVAPASDKCENYVGVWKRNELRKNASNLVEIGL